MAQFNDPIDLSFIGTKTPLQSKTIVTALTGILAVLAFAGVKLTLSSARIQQIADVTITAVTVIQYVMVIYFRWRATKMVVTTISPTA